MEKITTTDMLPAPVREVYELAKPLKGGPKFAFKCGRHDLTQIPMGVAVLLEAEGYLVKKSVPAEKTVAKSVKE